LTNAQMLQRLMFKLQILFALDEKAYLRRRL